MTNKLIVLPILAMLMAVSGRADKEWQVLSGHVPEIVSQLQPLGRLEGAQRLNLAIGLPSRDEPGLDTYIQQLYDPASTSYRHYLTPEQFTERFGPAEQDYNSLIDYVKAAGLNVTRQHSNRVVLDVEGAVADIEKAFRVTLRTYQHPTESRAFYAADVDPSIPQGLRILHIAGLNNYTLPHPRHVRHDDVTAKVGSGPRGQLWGNDFRNAYVPGTTLTGAGQNLGLVEFEGFYAKDITDYESAIGMSAQSRPQLVVVSLDGGATPQDGGDNGEECSLDIEMSVAMAPGLAKIYVFEDGGNGNGYFDDIFESMASYPDVLQFSCSWGGSAEVDPTSEVLFKQMAAQGQSFYNASGDSGAFVGPVEFPSDSPSITQVGGTTLSDGSAPSYPWESEVAWDLDSGPRVSAARAASTSGGISTYYAIPSWQASVSMADNLGSTTMRDSPDVAANADNCYIYSDDGQQAGGFGGTSCAAPLWAAFTALLNQEAAARKLAPVGFLNPALYALAAGPNYGEYFHDITSGNNTWRESPTQFYAVPGYDLCCGLGSMNGIKLISALLPSTGTGSQQSGSLEVTISPASAVTAGAKWQVDGGPWQKSRATVADLTVGNHGISFYFVNGWATPPDQTVAITADATATTSGIYVPVGSLKVAIEPALLTNAGAQWQVDGGPLENSGATVADLTAGNHVASFSPMAGWTAPSNRTVSIKAGSITTITGKYTLNAAGIYNGLFTQASVREGTSGMLAGLAVTSSATYSGRLLTAGSTNAISGVFNASGQSSNYVKRTASQGGPLTLAMTLNWNNSPPTITGTVSGANGGTPWVASLTNELAANTPLSAEYTVLVPRGPAPGYGYILITNHASAVTLKGLLADGASFSQEVPLSGNDSLPVYVKLYGGNGVLLGWLNLQSGSPSGNLAWLKQGSPSGVNGNGFTNLVFVQGSPWTNPPAGSPAIDLSSGQLLISSGGLAAPLSFNVGVNNNNALVKLPGSPTNSLTGSINPKTGLLTVTFGNGAGKATTTATGAVLQKSVNAAGFFLEKPNAGTVLLQP
jgi:hypothetical protein